MNSKISWATSLVFLLSYSTPTLSESDQILSWSDHALEKQGRAGVPALSSAPGTKPYWESFNRWICFPTAKVSVNRVGVLYEGEQKLIPQFDADSNNHAYEFAISSHANYDFDKIAREWDEILRSNPQVCFFAAFLQNLDNIGNRSASLWIINRVKHAKGYWIEPDFQ